MLRFRIGRKSDQTFILRAELAIETQRLKPTGCRILGGLKRWDEGRSGLLLRIAPPTFIPPLEPFEIQASGGHRRHTLARLRLAATFVTPIILLVTKSPDPSTTRSSSSSTSSNYQLCGVAAQGSELRHLQNFELCGEHHRSSRGHPLDSGGFRPGGAEGVPETSNTS